MRVETLRIEGFGPFVDAQTIDFDALTGDGMYLITGRTGAGKTSILDAICFALYGGIPRNDGAAPRLRSEHCAPGDPTSVELVFTVRGERYRVRRTPPYERPKNRGTGTTEQKATGSIARLGADGAEDVLSTSAAESATIAQDVLRLNREQFLQVVLLAQNRFAEFLRADSGARQELLRALFGTGRFDRLDDRLQRLRRDAEQAVESDRRAVETAAAQLAATIDVDAWTGEGDPALWATDLVARAEQRAADLLTAADRHRDAVAAAENDLERRRGEAEAVRRRDTARARQRELAQEGAAVDGARTELARSVVAGRILPTLDAADRRAAEERRAVETAAAARHALAARGLAPADGAEEALVARIDRLDRAVVDAEGLPALARGIEELDRVRAERRVEAGRLAERAAALPAESATAADEVLVHAAAAGGLDAAAADELRLRPALEAAREASALRARLPAASSAAESLAAAAAAASVTQQALLRAFVGSSAARLATGLTAGEPCPVCGALEHPAPATPPESGTVTAEELDAAETDAASRTRAARDAAEARDRLRADAERLAAAAGADETTLLAELDDARRRGGDARRAVGLRRDAEARVERLRLESAGLEKNRAAADAALHDLEAERSRLEHRLDALRAALRTALVETGAEDADAGAHRARLAADLDVLRRVRRAEDEATRARREARLAADELGSLLAATDLVDVTAVREATRTDAQHAALTARIRAHDDGLAAVAAELADETVAAAPTGPVDLAAPTEALALARAARDDAVHRHAAARAVATPAAALLARIRAAVDTGAAATRRAGAVARLAATVHGEVPNTRRMRLESYVLAAELEEIVQAANARLGAMTQGRFRLRHDDGRAYRNSQAGLGLLVEDAHTGAARGPHTLSGGETFLASLALALGLAEVVGARAGGVRLDTLFVDEGFGSLDGETLEIALATLDSLRTGGRLVGLISHVDVMQERIPAGLHVERTASGSSRVRTRTA